MKYLIFQLILILSVFSVLHAENRVCDYTNINESIVLDGFQTNYCGENLHSNYLAVFRNEDDHPVCYPQVDYSESWKRDDGPGYLRPDNFFMAFINKGFHKDDGSDIHGGPHLNTPGSSDDQLEKICFKNSRGEDNGKYDLVKDCEVVACGRKKRSNGKYETKFIVCLQIDFLTKYKPRNNRNVLFTMNDRGTKGALSSMEKFKTYKYKKSGHNCVFIDRIQKPIDAAMDKEREELERWKSVNSGLRVDLKLERKAEYMRSKDKGVSPTDDSTRHADESTPSTVAREPSHPIGHSILTHNSRR